MRDMRSHFNNDGMDPDWVPEQSSLLALQNENRRLRLALAAADVLAHQYVFTPFHERYWMARGGHGACTVCSADTSGEKP